jgi:tRNA threonylcarbamoyladenosine biosynthesis protein TsaB
LILETSCRVGQVALAQGPTLLGTRQLDEARRHARDLAPAVQELLAAQGWAAQTLNGVIVSRGPGSYTGLRVGIISAKTLAYATGCALIAVDTFAAIAAQALPEVKRLDVLADAQQGKVYVQRFERTVVGAAWQPFAPLGIETVPDWLATVSPGVWASGPGLRNLTGALPPEVRVLPPSCWDPQPASLLQLGLARFLRGEADDVWTLEPIYLRPSAAEEQWESRKSGS